MTMQNKIKTESRGFYEETQGVKVLHLAGSPYEIGFQHGSLLAKRIIDLIPMALDATVGVISKSVGIPYETARKKMLEGKEAARPHIPPTLLEEMRGITDGINSKESGEIRLEEIILYNTMYDQWCLYAHPHYSNPFKSETAKIESSDEIPNAGGSGSSGCSSFSAWGKAVKGDRLIFGKNMDNLNLPGILDNRILVFAKPDDGLGHAYVTHPGMIGIDGGLNTAGISMMTQYDAFKDETLEGCGIGIFTRLLLTQAQSQKEAIDILNDYPHCTGIAFHMADSKTNEAAIVNASATRIQVRYPLEGQNVLFTSNHTNCYPGWYGYEGYNMVKDQQGVYALGDVSTIESWQKSLRDPKNLWVPAPSRFERYEQLMHEHYGKITTEIAREILSDRYDPYTGNSRPRHEPSKSNNILATICALYPDDTYYKDVPSKTFSAHVSNLWSMVMTPENGDFWLAINDFPAQYGGYEYFNLNQELSKTPTAQIC